MPGYCLNEYLLVLQPPATLRNRIRAIKTGIAAACPAARVSKGASLILLARFTQYEMMEKRLIERLRFVAMGSPAFTVELKDFGSFPSHTIYLNVATKKSIQQLVKNIRKETQRLMKLNDDHVPHFILAPHLTLATKLPHYQFAKTWEIYKHKHFTGRFIAQHLYLLKKLMGDATHPFLPVESFPLQNMPIAVKQGELFR